MLWRFKQTFQWPTRLWITWQMNLQHWMRNHSSTATQKPLSFANRLFLELSQVMVITCWQFSGGAENVWWHPFYVTNRSIQYASKLVQSQLTADTAYLWHNQSFILPHTQHPLSSNADILSRVSLFHLGNPYIAVNDPLQYKICGVYYFLCLCSFF